MFQTVPNTDVAGVRTYYEVAGDGRPVVLLHGGILGAEVWVGLAGALSGQFRVLTPERRGHGHTPDVAGPISYSLMADDTIAFLDSVVGGAAHLVGWSDGALVGALVAMRRPEIVDRLVLIGQYYNPDGRTGAGADIMAELRRWRDDPPASLRENYDRVSPDGPEHFAVFFDKMLDMFAREPDIPLTEFAGISAPTLVLQGDRDDVKLEHSAAVVATIPRAWLAVLPGTHRLPLELPDLVNPLIAQFLVERIGSMSD